MKRINANNIIQFDLIDNIYLDDNLEPKIKISDISIISPGLTHLKDNYTSNLSSYILSPDFAGYIVDSNNISFQTDVYIFGIFVYLMFMKFLFLSKGKKYKLYDSSYGDKVRCGEIPYIGDNVPPFYRDLIEICCNHDPYERPTFAEIIEHLKNEKALIIDGKKVDETKVKDYINRVDVDNLPEEKKSTNESCQNYFIDDDIEDEFHDNVGQIGEGATSTTYKIIDKRTNIPMCKKVIKYRNGQTTMKDAQNAIKEFEVLYNLHHPCICRSIGINMNENIDILIDGKKVQSSTIAIFLEYEEYPLNTILNWNINNTFKTRIILDIVHAMKFLHDKGMMHRDLKIENIMLNALLETKIVDFGYVKLSECVLNDYSYVDDSLTKGIGTFAYMSPEMVNEEVYNNKTDVYSFGIMLYRIFLDSLPKQNMKEKANRVKIIVPKPKKPISEFCSELISKCIEPDSKLRPSFKDILQLMRNKSFMLAYDVDPSLISKRDEELEKIESTLTH